MKHESSKKYMRIFIIIWFILYIGIWIWTIDKFYTGSMNWWEYLLPVIAMSVAVPDMIMEVLKFMKKKK